MKFSEFGYKADNVTDYKSMIVYQPASVNTTYHCKTFEAWFLYSGRLKNFNLIKLSCALYIWLVKTKQNLHICEWKIIFRYFCEFALCYIYYNSSIFKKTILLKDLGFSFPQRFFYNLEYGINLNYCWNLKAKAKAKILKYIF